MATLYRADWNLVMIIYRYIPLCIFLGFLKNGRVGPATMGSLEQTSLSMEQRTYLFIINHQLSNTCNSISNLRRISKFYNYSLGAIWSNFILQTTIALADGTEVDAVAEYGYLPSLLTLHGDAAPGAPVIIQTELAVGEQEYHLSKTKKAVQVSC